MYVGGETEGGNQTVVEEKREEVSGRERRRRRKRRRGRGDSRYKVCYRSLTKGRHN